MIQSGKISSSEPVLVRSLFCDAQRSGVSRVTALVDGKPLWFESSDTELLCSPEGFASALLVPAMSHGKDLVFEDPLCETWLENTRQLIKVFSQWWGWSPIKVSSLSKRPVEKRIADGRALCFSGGVDSFYSLITYPEPIDTLILVQGYDINIDDNVGAQHTFNHMKLVAAARGIDAVMVKTNFREHHIGGKKYKHAFGGALAAIGHLVGDTRELIISSGYRYDEARPYGSHWQTDILWSSAGMKVVHYGAELNRDQKLRTIAAEPLVRKHLRTCQENLSDSFQISDKIMNCGRCLKCIRTLLVFQQEGGIDDLDIFENRSDLDVHLYRHQDIDEYFFGLYEEICRYGVSKTCELSIRALIRRSKIMRKFNWAGRKGRRLIFAFFRAYDSIERLLVCRAGNNSIR